jgi:hypothetical protein
MVMKIATEEIEEHFRESGKDYARESGLKGGRARAEWLTSSERRKIAKKASAARWGKAGVDK